MLNAFLKQTKILALAGLMLVINACSDLNSQENPEPYYQAAKIITLSPQHEYQVEREFTAHILAKQQTNLGFEFGGRVASTLKDSGEHVKQGEVIATLDTELLNIKADELKAQSKQVQAQLILNKANLRRIKILIEKGLTSEQSVDELEAEQAVLNANLEAVNSGLASVQYQITQASLTAPYSGTLVSRNISQGDVIAAGAATFVLIKGSQQELTLGLPVKMASKLTVNQQLNVKIDGEKLTANILAIGQSINPTNRTVQLRLALTESDSNKLRYNYQLVSVFINDTRQANGYWLPISALTDGIRGQWNIYQAQLTSANEAQSSHYQLSVLTVNVLHSTQTQAFISLNQDSISQSNNKPIAVVAEGLHKYVPGQTVVQQDDNLVEKSKGAD